MGCYAKMIAKSRDVLKSVKSYICIGFAMCVHLLSMLYVHECGYMSFYHHGFVRIHVLVHASRYSFPVYKK